MSNPKDTFFDFCHTHHPQSSPLPSFPSFDDNGKDVVDYFPNKERQ